MATEVQWSELQRDPKGVAALADRGGRPRSPSGRSGAAADPRRQR